MAVYLVTTPKGNRLVEARTTGAARNHVIKDEVEVKTLNTSELVKHINAGMKIETVIEEKADDSKPTDAAKPAAAASAPPTADKSTAQAPPAADAPKKGGLFSSKSAA